LNPQHIETSGVGVIIDDETKTLKGITVGSVFSIFISTLQATASYKAAKRKNTTKNNTQTRRIMPARKTFILHVGYLALKYAKWH